MNRLVNDDVAARLMLGLKVEEAVVELELFDLVVGSCREGIVRVDVLWYFSEVGKRIVQSSVLATAKSSELLSLHLRILRRGQNVATRSDG